MTRTGFKAKAASVMRSWNTNGAPMVETTATTLSSANSSGSRSAMRPPSS